MKSKLTEEWIKKAEGDFTAALTLSEKQEKNLSDAICFHCQQCIEKYLKAFLVNNNIEPPEVHDLQRLKVLCAETDKDFKSISEQLNVLDAYAVNFRYPGESAEMDDAQHALSAMKGARKFICEKLRGEANTFTSHSLWLQRNIQ